VTETFDVVVVGGGPAGSATALSLARVGCSVAMLERSDYDKPRVGETLPPEVKAPLMRLGLWDLFRRDCPSSSPAIQSAWGSATLHERNHFYNPHGSGWHIDRRRFDAMLARAALEAGVALKTKARAVTCDPAPSGRWSIRVDNGNGGDSMHARFLVDATGRSSAVARRLGARRVRHDRLVGIVGFFTQGPEAPAPSPITLVEAVETGWWYSASLPDARLVAACMTDADLYAKDRRRSGSPWLEQLQRAAHTQARVRAWTLDSRPLIVQADSSRLDRACGDNWLAVGDAAHAFDPLSGRGVFSALESGTRAAHAVHGFFSGERRDVAAYADTASEEFNRFLALRRKYYGQEGRWPDSVFWQRRRTAW
jgi:flavin-dependent dehydrogenase